MLHIMLKMCLVEFSSFFRGGCVRVTGLSENLGTQLKCVFYPKYYTFILKHRWDMEVHKKSKMKIISEGF